MSECGTCHADGSLPTLSLDGLHGLHTINDPRWVRSPERIAGVSQAFIREACAERSLIAGAWGSQRYGLAV